MILNVTNVLNIYLITKVFLIRIAIELLYIVYKIIL